MAATEIVDEPQTSEEKVDVVGLTYTLPTYEGPLDLLLDLIRKHEVDIFDIPISLITEEYLKYMDTLEQLDLELGGEWLEMAAMLILIKSKMLLPKEPTVEEDEDGPDPRAALVQRIIEYQKFKQAAAELFERPLLDHDTFRNPSRVKEYSNLAGPPQLRQASLIDLMGALQGVINRSKERGEWIFELNSQKLTLRSVILDVAGILKDSPRLSFDDLFEGFELSKHRIITTFLALLEMTRLKMIKLFQSELDDNPGIYVERAVVDILEVSQELELGGETV